MQAIELKQVCQRVLANCYKCVHNVLNDDAQNVLLYNYGKWSHMPDDVQWDVSYNTVRMIANKIKGSL